jgi:hypothetical protein
MKRTILYLMAVALALLACGGPEGVSTGPDLAMFEPNDPKYVLINVCIAFDYRHFKTLKASLCDDFVFYFSPEDVGANVNGYVIPESWTRDDFYAAAANIFVKAYIVDLDLSLYGFRSPGPGQTYCRVEDISTRLDVHADTYTWYLVYDGYSDFEFRGYAPGDGKTYWRVARWWDRTFVEPPDYNEPVYTTLGRILAMYH